MNKLNNWAYGFALNHEGAGVGTIYYAERYFDKEGIINPASAEAYTTEEINAIKAGAVEGTTNYVSETPKEALIGMNVLNSDKTYWYDEEAEEAVYIAIKNGYRLIDTAQYYGDEIGVGKGVRKAIDGGIVTTNSREGIEGTYIQINDGTLNLNASDDGINAGNKSNAYSTTIEINGGYITINMGSGDTDAIDSNGNLYINGGTLDITAQSPFDYDGTSKYTGGTIIVNGTTTNQITNQMMGGNGGNKRR